MIVRFAVCGVLLALVATAATGTVGVQTSLRDDSPLSGARRAQVEAAALERTGGGRLVKVERGDDGAAYAVEILLADGSLVEVNFDAGLNVLNQEDAYGVPRR